MAAKRTSAKVSAAKKDVKAALKKLDQAQDNIMDATEEAVNSRLDAVQLSVKQVWFAGLGALGRSVEEVKERYLQAGDELQARYTKLRNERESLLDDLVSRGEVVQDKAEARLREGRATVEERIDEVKERLNSAIDIPARLKDLSDKLESLSNDLKKSA